MRPEYDYNGQLPDARYKARIEALELQVGDLSKALKTLIEGGFGVDIRINTTEDPLTLKFEKYVLETVAAALARRVLEEIESRAKLYEENSLLRMNYNPMYEVRNGT